MGMTMTQKILSRHAGLDSVVPGQLIEAKVDMVLGNDITTPVAITEFEKAGFTEVFDKDKIAIVLDHYTPCKDIKSAQLCMQARNFARKHEIVNFFDVGQMGVEHALLPEKGLCAPVRSSWVQTLTPVPTALWALSLPASAPPIWPLLWQPDCCGSKSPPQSKSL